MCVCVHIYIYMFIIAAESNRGLITKVEERFYA